MKAWEQFLTEQRNELGSETVDKWLRTLKVLHFDACNLYLEANDSFQAIWFEEHIRAKAQAKLFNNNHKRIKVHLSVADQPASIKTPKAKGERNQPALHSAFKPSFDELNPSYLFEHFVQTEHSLITCKLLEKQASPGAEKDPHWTPFNPIFIYGPSGTGKTHLLMAFAHELRKQGKKAIYVRAETFTDHLVGAMRSGSMKNFRDSYRQTDALIIDDVQIFSKRAATQEELFHTFNALHLANKTIVLSSNVLPSGLQGVEPRLISRFEWGIVLPLTPPNSDELKQILEVKCFTMQFKLHPHVKAFLLETFSKSTKSFVGAFEALVLRAHMHHSPAFPLTLQHARHYLSDLIAQEQKRVLTPEQILDQVALFYGLPVDDILSKSQSRECTQPRQMTMFLCRIFLKMPFAKIGELFNRDHSTVMTSVKRIEVEVQKGASDISQTYERLKQILTTD